MYIGKLKYLMCFFALLFYVTSEMSAQRTMNGQNSIRAEALWNGTSFGADISFNQYTLGGYWEVGAFLNDYDINLSTRHNLDYMHLAISGGYMARLAGNRKRSIGLYAGGGAFIGAEISDYKHRLPYYIVTNIQPVGFIYGLYCKLSSEFFVSEIVALTVGCSASANFSSPMGIFKYNVGLGCIIML